MSHLPPWQQHDLPHAPAFTPRNVLRVLGPGAILLGASLGAGDWLLGPAAVVKHGPALLWLCTVSIVLQALLNTEMARYTLATGEPIFTGFMRTRPGARVWGAIYALLHLAQVGWPGWALAGGSALAALFLGRMPREDDRAVVQTLGYLLFLGSVAIVLTGERVHRAVERLEGYVMGGLLLLLMAAGIALVPAGAWSGVARGFLGPLLNGPALPPAPDWVLLAGLAAYAGAGGTVNATFTHWLRDKGLGMAGAAGVTIAAIGAQRIPLGSEGAIFPPTEENLAKWREWWRYLRADLWYLWTAGCLLGMGLPALLAAGLIPAGAEMGGIGAGAHLARAVGERLGFGFWMLALAATVWILFTTQLGISEGFARSATDLLWSAGARPRRGAGSLYVLVLGAFTLAGCAAMTVADPLNLVLLSANVAGLNFVILSLHTLRVNRRLLPPALRPSLWREAAVLACALFFGVLAAKAATAAGWLRPVLG